MIATGTALTLFGAPTRPHLTSGSKHWASMPASLRTNIGHLSRAVAAFAEHPLIQLGILVACVLWLAL